MANPVGQVTQVIGRSRRRALRRASAGPSSTRSRLKNQGNRLVLEVAQHLGEGRRCAPSPWTRAKASCAAREVRDTGQPIAGAGRRRPRSAASSNVIGDPVDEAGPGAARAAAPRSTKPAPSFTDQSTEAENSHYRHQGLSICWRLTPKGGKVGLFGGAGRRQDRHHHGVDQQRLRRRTAAIRCSPAWARAQRREGNDLYHEMIESGVNKDPKKNNGSAAGLEGARWSTAR